MFDDKTRENLKTSILAELSAAGWNTQEGSFADTIAGPMALAIQKTYQSMAAMIPVFYVDATSGLYIDKSANEFFGITRKPGHRATATITLTGEPGLRVPVDTIFLTSGGLEFSLDTDIIIGADGSGSGSVSSLGVGVIYNIAAGDLTMMHVNLAGLTGYFNEAAAGGVDAESDEALLTRLNERRKRPPTSGNRAYYEQLALEVDGVGLAKTIELYDGPGTVGVIIADKSGIPVSEAVRDACEAHIEEGRIVGTGVTVLPADGVGISVNATVVIDSSTTASAVESAFRTALSEYLASLAATWATTPGEYTLLYNRIVFLLLDIDGVVDYTALTVNGGTSNITLSTIQVPVLGEVTVLGAD